MSWRILFAFTLSLLLILPAVAHSTVITANSCALADVKTAISSAVNGDTVVIPAGTCTWGDGTTNIEGIGTECVFTQFDHSFCTGSTPKYITIQGSGTGQTIIIDQIYKNQTNPSAFRWKVNGGGLSRITGIEFHGTAGTWDCGHVGSTNSQVTVSGSSNQVRLDHNKFVTHGSCAALIVGAAPSASPTTGGYIRGVVDHNTFDVSHADPSDPAGAGAAGYCAYVLHQSWGDAGDNGDNSWAQPDSMGTDGALFFEDNVFHNDQSNGFYQICFDGWYGQRIVVRHNAFHATFFANHGTDSAVRGARQYEVYNNTWTGPNGISAWDLQGNTTQPPITVRGGVGAVFNNTITTTNGTMPTKAHQVVYFGVTGSSEANRAGIWGTCDGTSVWDQNSAGAPAGTGRLCLDQTGVGAGDLLDSIGGQSVCTAPFPKNVTQGCTQTWPRQATDPTYVWSNTVNGSTGGCQVAIAGGSTVTPIIAGTDCIDGTRPGYAPYAYPHPLVGTTLGSSGHSQGHGHARIIRFGGGYLAHALPLTPFIEDVLEITAAILVAALLAWAANLAKVLIFSFGEKLRTTPPRLPRLRLNWRPAATRVLYALKLAKPPVPLLTDQRKKPD